MREELAIIRQRRAAGKKRRREGARLAGQHERHGHHPKQRKDSDGAGQSQHPVDQERRGAAFHVVLQRGARRSSSAVTANMTTNSRKATAEADPRFHHLKPSSYMK